METPFVSTHGRRPSCLGYGVRPSHRRAAPDPRQHQAHVMCINVRARWNAAHSAVADGPRAGLQPLKWEPGDERPAFAGLSAGASSAGALDEEDVGAHAQQQDKALSVGWSSIAMVGDLPTVAPATGAPAGSPVQTGRPVPGSHFSGCRPARGPSATAEWAALQRARTLMHITWAGGHLRATRRLQGEALSPSLHGPPGRPSRPPSPSQRSLRTAADAALAPHPDPRRTSPFSLQPSRRAKVTT